jgi:hypothetical protein
MKDSDRRSNLRRLGVRFAVGLATLSIAWSGQGADRPRPGNRQPDTTWVRSDHRNDSRVSRSADSSRTSAAPRFTSSPRLTLQSLPQRVVASTRPRVTTIDSGTGGWRQPTTIRTGQRSGAPEIRTWLAASDDKGRDDKGAKSTRGDNRGSGNATPPTPRRDIQSDTPKPPRQDAGGNRGERHAPSRRDTGTNSGGGQPLPPATGERSKISDVRRRLDSPNTSSDAGSSTQNRSGNGGQKAVSNGTSATKIGTPQPEGQRTKAADVRKRLGGQTRDDSSSSSGQRDRVVIPPGKGVPKSGGPKIITTDAGRVVQPGGRATSNGAAAGDAKITRFSDRLKAGELDRLTKGETAKKIKLADQFHMLQQGDVARRLDLHSHAREMANVNRAANAERFRHGIDTEHRYVFHPNFYHGVVGPAFARHSLQYYYWGPAFFAGLCWYPQWQPWVGWSWHYHCPVYWDPRPIWCRPVFYDPCPHWVYWSVPTWTPLPAVGCGTWVDLEPVVVAPAAPDLQLVAVRFVDPGHPEEKQGPRYRVWFRNVGNQPIARPFNVMLFAANGPRLMADLPQAGVRVTAIEAGGTQSVDIRLPGEVYTMNRDAQGKPAPFSTLHVLVDANRETADVTRTNNGVRLAPAEILPVDPAAFESDPTDAKPGTEMILAGEGFGPEPGQLLLHVGGQEVQGEILGWYDLGVRWSVPKLPITATTEAEVIVVRGDGAAANPLKINIKP